MRVVISINKVIGTMDAIVVSRNKPTTAILALCLAFFAPNPIYASDKNPKKYRISVGGYSLMRSDLSLSLTEPSIGVGVSINPEDTLGLATEQTVFRLSGHYRYSKQHRLTYSWYRISSKGKKLVEKEFEWVDGDGNSIIIPVGAQATTILNYNVFKVGYLWSFHTSDKVELATGIGLHTTFLKVGLQAEATGAEIDVRDVSVNIPLPVLSFNINYKITPNISWYYKTEIFYLAFKDWQGDYSDNSLGMEFFVSKNVGLGVGIGRSTLKISENNTEYKFSFENQITGINLYVSANF